MAALVAAGFVELAFDVANGYDADSAAASIDGMSAKALAARRALRQLAVERRRHKDCTAAERHLLLAILAGLERAARVPDAEPPIATADYEDARAAGVPDVEEAARWVARARRVAAVLLGETPLGDGTWDDALELARAARAAAEAATRGPVKVTPGYNNGGVPTAFLAVPGRQDAFEVEMLAEDAAFFARAQADVLTLAENLERLDRWQKGLQQSIDHLAGQLRGWTDTERKAQGVVSRAMAMLDLFGVPSVATQGRPSRPFDLLARIRWLAKRALAAAMDDSPAPWRPGVVTVKEGG